MFSLEESKRDASVMVIIEAPGMAGDGYGKEYEGRLIKAQKYNIHPSLKSRQQINMNKCTTIFDEQRERMEYHATAAMKVHGLYAPVVINTSRPGQ